MSVPVSEALVPATIHVQDTFTAAAPWTVAAAPAVAAEAAPAVAGRAGGGERDGTGAGDAAGAGQASVAGTTKKKKKAAAPKKKERVKMHVRSSGMTVAFLFFLSVGQPTRQLRVGWGGGKGRGLT
jgi:hypothetical protein